MRSRTAAERAFPQQAREQTRSRWRRSSDNSPGAFAASLAAARARMATSALATVLRSSAERGELPNPTSTVPAKASPSPTGVAPRNDMPEAPRSRPICGRRLLLAANRIGRNFDWSSPKLSGCCSSEEIFQVRRLEAERLHPVRLQLLEDRAGEVERVACGPARRGRARRAARRDAASAVASAKRPPRSRAAENASLTAANRVSRSRAK